MVGDALGRMKKKENWRKRKRGDGSIGVIGVG